MGLEGEIVGVPAHFDGHYFWVRPRPFRFYLGKTSSLLNRVAAGSLRKKRENYGEANT